MWELPLRFGVAHIVTPTHTMELKYAGAPVHTIRHDKRKFLVCVGGKWRPVKGVRDFVKRMYFPNWYQRKLKDDAKPATGLRVGSKVDSEVTRVVDQFYAKYPKFSVLDNGDSLDPSARLAWAFASDDLHKYTLSLFTQLEGMGMRPVASQVCVGVPSLNMATAVDLVCELVGEQTLVLVEIKTGYNQYLEQDTGMMRAPFTAIKNHPLNQHRLQAATTEMLFRATYTGIGRVNARNGTHVQSLVAVANRDGCAIYGQLPEFKHGSSEMRHLRAHAFRPATSGGYSASKRKRAPSKRNTTPRPRKRVRKASSGRKSRSK